MQGKVEHHLNTFRQSTDLKTKPIEDHSHGPWSLSNPMKNVLASVLTCYCLGVAMFLAFLWTDSSFISKSLGIEFHKYEIKIVGGTYPVSDSLYDPSPMFTSLLAEVGAHCVCTLLNYKFLSSYDWVEKCAPYFHRMLVF